MKKAISQIASTMKTGKGMLIFAGIAVVGLFAWSRWNAPEPPANTSIVTQSAMNETTVHGTATPLDPDYVEALTAADKQRIEEAKTKGGSAMPTIQGNITETQAPLEIDVSGADTTPVVEEPEIEITQQPLPIQVPLTETVPLVTAPPPAVVAENPERVSAMLAAMARRPLVPAEVVAFNAVTPVVPSADQSAPAVGATEASAEASKVKLPLAGKILYAQLVGRANSDHPGPVLAKILQGEYTGATLIGTFQVSQNALTISFDRMTVEKSRDGEEINETVPIQAVAVDTKYIGSGLATKVDRHLFQKLAIAFTAGFAQGFGDAISQTGETTIDTGNGTITTGSKDLDAKEELLSAGGQAVSEAGSILQQEFGNRPTTVIVEAGTPIGVLFLQ
jgi:intracellular multiplication protein IcmE|nr:TrbI/VirB10 family protein [Neorhizobium tomejilense]